MRSTRSTRTRARRSPDNAKDICVAEAKGKANVAKAEAEAAYKHTPKARENARIAHAQANYNVAIEKCDDLAGNRKDVCVKEAKSELVKGKANAKVDRVAADTNKEAATKQAEARKDASADKREAEYKVAIEKCDALAGPAKDACVSSAKSQYRQVLRSRPKFLPPRRLGRGVADRASRPAVFLPVSRRIPRLESSL